MHVKIIPPLLLYIEPRVPYYISVVAINQLGEGNSAMAIAFTKSESKQYHP